MSFKSWFESRERERVAV